MLNNETTMQPITGDNFTVNKIGNYTIVNFWLSGVIGDMTDYMPLLKELDKLQENDSLIMHINCYGGRCDTAIQLRNIIQEKGLDLKVIVEGVAMSAATWFFDIANCISINKNTRLLFHGPSGGTWGSISDMRQDMNFEHQFFEELFKDMYNGLLTDKEIHDIVYNELQLRMKGSDFEKRVKAFFDDKSTEAKEMQKIYDKHNKRVDAIIKDANKELVEVAARRSAERAAKKKGEKLKEVAKGIKTLMKEEFKGSKVVAVVEPTKPLEEPAKKTTKSSTKKVAKPAKKKSTTKKSTTKKTKK